MKRAYHRIVSGVQFGKGPLRFVTLTSSPESPPDIRDSLKKAKKFMKRRGLDFQYFAVSESFVNGLRHLHILYRGPFLYQWWLSLLWEKYHKARVVDIRKTYGSKRGISSYLCKYLLKNVGETLSPSLCGAQDAGFLPVMAIPDKLRKLWSCSFDWCYRRFSVVWGAARSLWKYTFGRVNRKVLFELWRQHLEGDVTPAAFLVWVSDVAGVPQLYDEFVSGVRGNEGYFETRARLGYE